jgi:hypothetical protein
VERLSIAALLIAGCGSMLSTVPTGPHPSNGAEPIIVEYPPPPAEIELITERPAAACMWQDGHFVWLGRRWNWEPGRWVVPPEGCYHASPVTVWVPSEQKGELYYMQPRWYPAGAEELPRDQVLTRCGEPRPCGPAATTPGD